MVESSRAGTEWTLSRMNFQSPLLSQHVREVPESLQKKSKLEQQQFDDNWASPSAEDH